jgi:hypothetical protein
MADQPIQHTPVHQRGDVFDPRHPAASAFAVAQPGAGVVSDDAHEKGQNLAGGPPAAEAEQTYADQREVLVENYDRDLRAATGNGAPAGTSDDEKSGETEKSGDTGKAPAKTATAKSSTTK